MATRTVAPLAASAVVFAVFLSACGRAPTVETAEITETAFQPPPTFDATVESDTIVDLSFPIAGTVKAIVVDAEGAVSAGEPVARLDPAPVEGAIRDAEAELQKARDALAAKEADIQRLGLLEGEPVPPPDPEQLQQELEAVQLRVDEARVALEATRRLIGDTEILAPFDGVVATIATAAFNSVGAGETVATAYAWDSVGVSLDLAEPDLERIGVNEAVSIAIPDIDLTVDGTVAAIAADETESGGTVVGWVSLMVIPDTIRTGMKATVTVIEPGPPEAIGVFVPLSAIIAGSDGGSDSVFKYDSTSETVTKVDVTVGEKRDNAAVVSNGLAIGDVVVTGVVDGAVSSLSDDESVSVATQ
ncbi:efflux RND transporter periplasmic adaptor subunit [Bauldia sp.]|uniref:efflux RND transporter periplasmic adaptor subunit n=1 Tax=Bauldia sp. TaxID=2575872 RepID=UPI003BA9A6B9